MSHLAFEILHRGDGGSRLGRLTTPQGSAETPVFMPVGTLGAVKGVVPDQLEEAGASIMLANLYHLSLRPGVETIEELGGIHRFTGWHGPILTDSGGYQVFSLAELRAVDAEGVTFRNHVDGKVLRLTPETVVELQNRLGVDMAMVLDECPPWPVTREEASESLDRTLAWAARSREAWLAGTQGSLGAGGLFGIVQGSVYEELRAKAAEALVGMDFEGYAIGGVSVGEPGPDRRRAVEWSVAALPEDKPRYLMGVGYPLDILHAVSHGVDLFDCVLPARNARHGLLFTRAGELRIKNTRFRDDPRPIDAACSCPTCRRVSRAFVHHLFRSKEILGGILATLHNLRYYLDFMEDLRHAIASGTLGDLRRELEAGSSGPSPPERPNDRARPARSDSR